MKVEEFLVDLDEGRDLSRSSVRKDDIELALVLRDGFVQTLNVLQVCDIALHAGDVSADLSHRPVQHILTSARNEYVIHAFFDEALRRGEAYSGGCSGYHGFQRISWSLIWPPFA